MDGSPRHAMPRPPHKVMRLARMGSTHPSRLSFMRIMLRRLEAENWKVDRPVWEIDRKGVGRAVYRVTTPERCYSLVAFAHDLPDELRSDRVIAEAWDATFALFDGEPCAKDLDRLSQNVPLQEAGRMQGSELTLSRANRSVRMFGHVVDCLAEGRQPEASQLDRVGYLMRTTAVYGSGKFGLSDREAIAERPELNAPFQAEMLTVWLIRAFTVDIVEHLAQAKSADAVALDPVLRRRLGVGNSTGLGMAPFLLNHPVLIHNWFAAREQALARVRGEPVTEETWDHFLRVVAHAHAGVASWLTEHPYQVAKLEALDADLSRLQTWLAMMHWREASWDALWLKGEAALSIEGQEMLLSLLLEPHGTLVDSLASELAADEAMSFPIDARQTVGSLRETIETLYDWVAGLDWSRKEAQARLWYTSAEKLEPRLGDRADLELDAYEQPLGPARDVAALSDTLAAWPVETPLAQVLAASPEHRHTVRRVQIVAAHPYGEVRDNTLAAEMVPIDLLRAKLAFFGASRFDPRSDLWLRISMFQGAPIPQDVGCSGLDNWMYGP
ncbi:MAG: hypothetical protein AB8B85_02405 [Paracoccaceae bacterium]